MSELLSRFTAQPRIAIEMMIATLLVSVLSMTHRDVRFL